MIPDLRRNERVKIMDVLMRVAYAIAEFGSLVAAALAAHNNRVDVIIAALLLAIYLHISKPNKGH